MSREWKVLMKKSAGVIENASDGFLFTRTTNQVCACADLATAAITGKPRSVFSLFHCGKKIIAVIVHGAGMCTGTEVRNDLILEIYGRVSLFHHI